MIQHDQSGYPIVPDREDYESGFGELVERCEVCERINCICPIDNGLSKMNDLNNSELNDLLTALDDLDDYLARDNRTTVGDVQSLAAIRKRVEQDLTKTKNEQ